MRYLAADLGPSNIRVNAISAGAVKTTSARGIRDFSKMLEGGAKFAPLRRNTDPAEVADTAVFLASDLGRGVTGNILYVDAGMQIMGLPCGMMMLRPAIGAWHQIDIRSTIFIM